VTRLTIDNREVEVSPGATILNAAERLGIEIPTLCHLRGCSPSTSCLVCMVKILPSGRMVPACGTPAVEGMIVESETDEVRAMRRCSLELLLGDHLGDCVAPCSFGCPAHMNIPRMLRQIAAGDLAGAVVTIKEDIAMPAVLGRICPAPCEKVCRRTALEGTVRICELKRIAADADLDSADPYTPRRPTSGESAAIVGGGPAGLATAYYLARLGHNCTIFDENQFLGGMLATEIPAEKLPPEVLRAEIDQILKQGIEVRLGVRIGRDISLGELRAQFGVVMLAIGCSAAEQAPAWDVKVAGGGITVAHGTYETNLKGVFAVGNALRGEGTTAVRSVNDGKEGAFAADQYLRSEKPRGVVPPFTTRIGRMDKEELYTLARGTNNIGPSTTGAVPDADAGAQAARCLHCDCRALTTCKLRKYSIEYDADPRRYRVERRRFKLDTQHTDVLFEQGKCIDCGLCVQICESAGETLGMSYIGRGFDVRIGVPLGGDASLALQKVAAQCVAACPTAALAWKRD
jgi:ferredoxin